MNDWITYILLCSDGTLYTGITKNLASRVEAHNHGKGAKYTRGRTPVEVFWSQDGLSESEARKEEARIKKLSKQEKKLLSQNQS